MKTPAPPKTPLTLTVLWIAKLGAAGILGYAGYLKFAGNPGDVALFEKLNMEPFGRYVIGALEMLAAVLIILPKSAIYGALLGLGVMCGAIIGHLTVLGTGHLHMAILVFVLCLTILWIRRYDARFLRNLVNHYDYEPGKPD